VPTADIEGIRTHYDMIGSGPPLLMFSPGGFNAVAANWTGHGVYRRIRLLEHLPKYYTCIFFDRREAGESGGRLERISWHDYARQGLGLLNHLDIDRAHLIGGCVGCTIASALAVSHPERVDRMVLYSPAGGPRYRMSSRARFEVHLSYVREHGLPGVAKLAGSHGEGFSEDPRIGPWGPLVRRDPAFADEFVRQNPDRYEALVTGMARTLFDRDTVPGPEPEDLMNLDVPTLIVPGQDRSHAPSAARYLEECLPHVEYWDIPVSDQTETTAPARLHTFLLGAQA
jgi:pimeloyl-ACP methyl ester carboxylesterase